MSQQFEKISKVLATSLGITAEELILSYNRATKADLPEVCELLRLGFGDIENFHEDVIAWRYFNFSAHSSDIFVLRYKDELIGAVGAEPLKIKVGGVVYDGIRAGDIVVHPDHLKRGIGGWMNMYLQDKFPITMAMGSNENSNTMVRRLFKAMNCRHHLKILFSTQSYLEAKGCPPVFAKALSFFSLLPLNIARNLKHTELDAEYKISIVENTSNLASFFSDADYSPRDFCIALRSAEYCQWRYDLNPISNFFVFEMHCKDKMIGYAIVKKSRSDVGGDWQLMDWDLLLKFRSEKNYQQLFAFVVMWVATTSAESLSVLASDRLSVDSLVSSGFSLRGLEDGFFLRAKSEIDESVMDENNWFLSYCDTDEAL